MTSGLTKTAFKLGVRLHPKLYTTMQLSRKELTDLLANTSFNLNENNNEMIIKSKLNLLDKSHLGSVFLILGGCFMGYITVNEFLEMEHMIEIVGIIIFAFFSLLLTIGGFLAVYSSSFDFIKVDNKCIEFKNNSFKTVRRPISRKMEIRYKTYSEYIKTSSKGSNFRNVELYLVEEDKEERILNFMMNESEKQNAIKLGKLLKAVISERIKKSLNIRGKA